MDTGGGLLRYTNHALGKSGPLRGLLGQLTGKEGKNDLELSVVGGLRVGESLVGGVSLLGLDTLVDEKSHVSSIIDNKVASITLGILRPCDGVEGALPVLLKSLSLPGEDCGRAITGNSSSGVILGGEDVATAPSDFSTHLLEGLNEDRGLDGHVEGA